MIDLIIAAVLVLGAYWLLRQFAYAPPNKVAGLIRRCGGVAVLGIAGFFALRGGYVVAVPLMLVGLGLLGQTGLPWGQKTSGRTSRVTTGLLAMELDHDTGRMDGEILIGSFRGRRLSELTDATLQSLHAQSARTADQSQALLESWLDRNKPGWRERWGYAQAGQGQTLPTPSGMTQEEAYAVLGLKKGATADAIRAAHRRLMKELHPDRGGSDYLAAKVNQAKDVLLPD